MLAGDALLILTFEVLAGARALACRTQDVFRKSSSTAVRLNPRTRVLRLLIVRNEMMQTLPSCLFAELSTFHRRHRGKSQAHPIRQGVSIVSVTSLH